MSFLKARVYVFALVALLLVLPAASFAQTATGVITGRAADASGALIPGVEVTITSPAMIGGGRNAPTDETGTYRFTQLAPGTYRVTFALPGFKTRNVEGVNVVAGVTSTINGTMEVSTVAEEVTVTSDAPQIDLEAATVGVNWSAANMDKIPYGRDIRGLAQLIPGIYTPNYDVGGNTLGGSTTISGRVYGRSGGELLSFEGVVWDQFFGDYLTYQEVNVAAAAKGAEAQSAGATVSFVIKSGGNDFHGSSLGQLQKGAFQSDNVTQKLRDQGYVPGKNKFTKLWEVNGDVGGPIKRDKLWFYTAFSYQYSGLFLPGFISDKTGEQVEYYTSLHNPTVKLTYQLNDKMKLELVEQLNRKWQPYRGGSLLVSKEASQNQLAWTAIGPSLKWTYILSPKQTVDASVNRSGYWWPDYAWDTGIRKTDQTLSINRGPFLQVYRRPIRWGWNSTWSYFANLGGKSHEIKAGINGYWDKNYTDQFGYPDSNQVIYRYRSIAGEVDTNKPETFNATAFKHPDSIQTLDYPNFTTSGVNYESWFANDKITLSRKLTVNVGFRMDHYSSWLPEQGNYGTGPWSTKAFIPESRNYPEYTNYSPRFSMVYDVKGDGKLALKASYGKYVGAGSGSGTSNGPRASQVNTNAIRTCTYNGWTGTIPAIFGRGADGLFCTRDDTGPYNTAVAPSASGGGGAQVLDPDLKGGPITHEYTAGFELGLPHNFQVRFNAVHKLDYGGNKTLDLAQPYSAYTDIRSGTDPGPDNKFGTTDDKTLYVYSVPSAIALGVNQRIVNYAKDERNRLYTAYETTVNKRFSHGWTALAGYTLDYQKSSNEIPQTPNAAVYNQQNPFWSYSLKMSGTYDIPLWGLKWGGTYNAQSGDPYARTVSLRDGRGSNISLRVEGIAGRYSWVKLMDNRVSKSFKIGDHQSIEAQWDLFNTLNSSVLQSWPTSQTAVPTGSAFPSCTTGPFAGTSCGSDTYHKPTVTGGIDASAASPIIAPRIYRLGVRYRF